MVSTRFRAFSSVLLRLVVGGEGAYLQDQEIETELQLRVLLVIFRLNICVRIVLNLFSLHCRFRPPKLPFWGTEFDAHQDKSVNIWLTGIRIGNRISKIKLRVYFLDKIFQLPGDAPTSEFLSDVARRMLNIVFTAVFRMVVFYS